MHNKVIAKVILWRDIEWSDVFSSLNQEKEAMNRSLTMEDLHNQLQMNIEANKELNQRVSQKCIL